jgi:hypothetical protein
MLSRLILIRSISGAEWNGIAIEGKKPVLVMLKII